MALASALLLAPSGAAGHVTSIASSDVTVSGDVIRYELTVSSHDLAVALGIETDLKTPVPPPEFKKRAAALAEYLRQRLIITAQQKPCSGSEPTLDFPPQSDLLRVSIAFRCPAAVTRLTITYQLFFDIDRNHNNIMVVTLPNRQLRFLLHPSFKKIALNVEQPSAIESWTTRFGRVFVLGIKHILIGYDHILFLFALLIVNARIWQIVKVVTAFTIAHSITLALAWFGIVDLPSRLVESLIALSIAYVAIENLIGKGFGHRWLLAGGLGLVHGLGFYSVLSDLGLAKGHALSTLVAFNLGVEAGQLVVVALVFGPLSWWVRQPWYRQSATVASTLILLVASWLVVERAFAIPVPIP